MTLQGQLKYILQEINNENEHFVEIGMRNLYRQLESSSGIYMPPYTPLSIVEVMHDTEFDATKSLSVGTKPHLKVGKRLKDTEVANTTRLVIPAFNVSCLNGGRWSQHMLFEFGIRHFCVRMQTMVDHNCTFDGESSRTLRTPFGGIK